MKFKDEDRFIGLDETGVGEYFTTLVCASVFIPKNNLNKVKNMEVCDSKKMTDLQILHYANKLKNLVFYKLTYATPSNYNILTNNNLNAHEIKTLLHFQALDSLIKELKSNNYWNSVDGIVLDGFVSEKNLQKYFNKLQKYSNFPSEIPEFMSIEKADSQFLSVAVASILARDFMLTKLEEQKKRWNFHFSIGTNDKIVDEARHFVKKYGSQNLNQVAKVSFKTTEKVLN